MTARPSGPPPSIAPSPLLLATRGWPDYALLDSGGGRKLERCGPFRVVRPEPQCLWTPRLQPAAWTDADAVFEAVDEDEAGRWRFARPLAETWPMAWEGVGFLGRFTAFRHLGLFPEQAANWTWLKTQLAGAGPAFRLLNLFGYTGVASLVAASLGAAVTHVDASRKAVAWARENAAAAGLREAPIRWICEDAAKYVAREVRRGARYQAIVLDPPKYGRGPAGEVWRLLEDLPTLMAGCADLLADDAAFLVVNAYSERLSGLALAGLAAEALSGRDGVLEWGELALMEEGAERGVGLSFFARWLAAP
ncbi:MAG: class I SAM-dependent methyltransferase [Caulobacteraceae bacterium]